MAPGCRVHLLERRAGFGQGMAYSTGNSNHLLNVPAGRMSAFNDAPDDFVQWLAQQDDIPREQANAGAFVARGLFGRYVQSLLSKQLRNEDSNRNLYLFPDEAVGLEQDGDGVTIQTAGGRPVRVSAAILAVGNFPPEAPPADASVYQSPRYLSDPWEEEAISRIPRGAHVLVIGSGLTMVDFVISLLDKGHRGPVTALSRRGLVPHRHSPLPVAPAIEDQPQPRMSDLLHQIRHWVRAGDSAGTDWRTVIDGIRPHLQNWWLHLADDEKRRFLRHVRPWWDIHRHRLAPQVAERLESVLRNRKLRVLAGYIQSMTLSNRAIEVTYRKRGTDQLDRLRASYIVNCSGPASDYTRISHPLVRKLLDGGTVRPDAFRLGLDVDATLRLIDADGKPNDRLFAVGPVTKGRYWEVTAVPELRRQTEMLAKQLASEFCTAGVT
jgi:uncharacterized NAD(P)/FAD-binding protein YdhS